MATLCAQYHVEITFDDYIDGSPIDHTVLENEMRTALQNRLDELMSTGARRNPLVPTMYVTGVSFETDYPHPDSLPADMRDYEPAHWVAFLRKMDQLGVAELTDVQYVNDRIIVHTEDLKPVLSVDATFEMAKRVAAHVKETTEFPPLKRST